MSEDRGERKKQRPRGRKPRRKVCDFCVNKIAYIDDKDVNRLRRYIDGRGKIMPRRMYRHLRKASASVVQRPSSAPVPSRCCPTRC